MTRKLTAALLTVLAVSVSGASCTGSSEKGGDTSIVCFNNQPVQVVLPTGQFPIVEGDGAVVGDTQNPDGTTTFTVSGCNFQITGDTTITSGDTGSDNTSTDNSNHTGQP